MKSNFLHLILRSRRHCVRSEKERNHLPNHSDWTKAVFMTIEMNNEWHLRFLQNTNSVLKKYRAWSCIYQDRNEQWMKHYLFSRYETYSKNIKNEAVFTKRKINNEWNFDFLQNTSCVEKVSRLKLYLPRKKWTMNETLIFFKIKCLFCSVVWSHDWFYHRHALKQFLRSLCVTQTKWVFFFTHCLIVWAY